MNYRLILVAEKMSHEILASTQQKLAAKGFIFDSDVILSDSGHRAEISFNSVQDQHQLKELLRQTLAGSALDGFVLERDHHLAPQLLIMDMDSTLVQAETIDQIAKHVGRMDEVAAITESAMRGELDFTASLKKRVAMLEGLSKTELEQVHQALPLTSGAEALIRAAKVHNCMTVLVSGGFTYFAQPIADQIGIDEVYANELAFENDRLTGYVIGTIVDAEFKQKTLNRIIQERAIQRQQTIAIGDGANDLLMLKDAGVGIAFHGKPRVQEQAQAVINRYGLEALQWLLNWH